MATTQTAPTEDAPQQAAGSDGSARRRRWRMPWTQSIAGVLILLGVCVFLYPQTASWFSQREQSRATEHAQERLAQPPNNDARVRAAELDRARQYNDALISGARLEAGANIPRSDGATEEDSLEYAELLNLAGDDFMGRLQYDGLGIDLPIYHGTDDATLLKGIGHLQGTSLPVGGEGTRAVLTAHRGLPEATLFNDLDRAKVGDTFTVSVLGEVLTYKVTESRIIEPTDTETLLAEPGKDLMTLVTCTPLGINSHRILVTGERITPTPEADLLAAQRAPEIPGFPWWSVILGGTVVVIGSYVWRAGYATGPERPRKS